MPEGRRIALVTGAARGIGRAIALELGRNGCHVAVNFNRSAEAARSLCDELAALGARALPFGADVSDGAQVERLFKEVRDAMGPVEVLVNNAGVTRDGLLMRMKDADWDAVIAANLTSAFRCAREAIRDMSKARWGRIVSVASVVGLIGNAGQANYAASKAGLIGLTRSLAREYASRGITANAVAPGFIDTDMTGALKEEVRASIAAQIPAGHIGTPEDVARAVAFLTGEGSGYITGQVLAIDGGMTMC